MSASLTSAPDRELGLKAISARFGSNATSNADIVGHHAHDESFHLPARPDLVVYAESTEDVADCVRLCAQHRIPVIPFGVGTSLEGHVNAVYGGVSLDMSRMNRVLRLSVEDLDCTVQAGILRQQDRKSVV